MAAHRSVYFCSYNICYGRIPKSSSTSVQKFDVYPQTYIQLLVCDTQYARNILKDFNYQYITSVQYLVLERY
jgi:hypothetical protein